MTSGDRLYMIYVPVIWFIPWRFHVSILRLVFSPPLVLVKVPETCGNLPWVSQAIKDESLFSWPTAAQPHSFTKSFLGISNHPVVDDHDLVLNHGDDWGSPMDWKHPDGWKSHWLMYSWHTENHTVEIVECREQMRLSCVQPLINPEYSWNYTAHYVSRRLIIM